VQAQEVCAAPSLTRNPYRVWKAHAMETKEAVAAMVGEGRGGLRCGDCHWSDGDGGGHQRRRQRPLTAAVAAFGVDKWRFHGCFAAARGEAHDIAFGCFGGGF